MNDPLNTMADLLLELERELRAQGLWADEPPAPEHLSSTTPFAADLLDLEQWLQWIFVPTIKQMIEAGADLPEVCNIHPYAEECLKEMAEAERLLSILSKIDRHITDA